MTRSWRISLLGTTTTRFRRLHAKCSLAHGGCRKEGHSTLLDTPHHGNHIRALCCDCGNENRNGQNRPISFSQREVGIRRIPRTFFAVTSIPPAILSKFEGRTG